MPNTSSIQPSTFAQVDAQYSSVSARCICGDTLKLKRAEGEDVWVHGGSNHVWCRRSR